MMGVSVRVRVSVCVCVCCVWVVAPALCGRFPGGIVASGALGVAARWETIESRLLPNGSNRDSTYTHAPHTHISSTHILGCHSDAHAHTNN